MQRIYIGIDPGRTGAIAAMNEHGEIVYCCDTPDIESIINGVSEIRDLGDCRGSVEQVHAMPGQGVCSMFTFGEMYGAAQAAFIACRVSFVRARPQVWSKNLLSPGTSSKERKIQSVLIANARYPGASKFLTRKKDHGRADAMHIANYARKYYSNCSIAG